MLEEAIRPVAKRGRGPTFTIALVVLAFVLGVVRPWDWLPNGGAASDARPGGEAAATGALVTGSGDAGGTGATPAGPTPTPAPGSVEAAAQVCAYPQGWRSATLQNYAGRRALVWTAVDAVSATGPLDPSIPFEGVAGDTFTAIGWCAPVDGPDRPPDGTTARLFRVADGRATPEPYVRLHPAAPNPLGELWGPVGSPAASPGPVRPRATSTGGEPGTRGFAGRRGRAAAGTVARRGRDGADLGARALPDRARGARRRLRPLAGARHPPEPAGRRARIDASGAGGADGHGLAHARPLTDGQRRGASSQMSYAARPRMIAPSSDTQ